MNYLSKITVTLLGIFPAVLSALNEPGNLLKDFELNSPKENWNCKQNVQRQTIEAFEGLADTLCYLTGKSGTTLSQPVAVKENTWYTMAFLFRTRGEYAKDKTYAYNLLAGILPEGETSIWKGMETRTFGGSHEWNRGVVFFNSGKNRTVTPFVAFLGNSEWDVGRIFLRETTPEDFRTNAVLDPGFERSAPGMIPVEFRRTGKSKDSVVSVCSGTDAKSGKQALKVQFTDSLRLVGGRFLAKAGDKFKAGIYLKASEKVFATLLVTGTAPRSKIRRLRRLEVGQEWTFLSVEGVVPATGTGTAIHPLQIYLSLESGKKGAKATVWGDDVSFDLSSPSEAQAGTERPRIWNDSFETGPYGWQISFYEDPRYTGTQTRGYALDNTTAGHGTHSLRIQKSRMPEELKKLCRINSMPLRIDNEKKYIFSFMAKADRPTTIAAAFPYKGIGTFQITEKWQRFYSAPVQPGRWYVRPGYNRIRLTSPLDGSTIWLDAFQLEAADTPSPFRPFADYEAGIFFEDYYKIFPLNGKRNLQIMAVSHHVSQEGTMELKITDFFGKTCFRSSRPVTLEAGKAAHWKQELQLNRPGYFRAEISLLDRNRKKLAENITTYAVLAPPRDIAYPESWCGILGGLDDSGRRGSREAHIRLTGASLDEALETIRSIGYKWIRIMGIGNWRNTEPVRGTYEWKWDEYLTTLKKHRFGILAEYLSHDAQPWSNSGVTVKEKLQGGFHYTAKAEDVAKFSVDFARRYRGKIDSINLMNETNGYPPEEYLKIMKAVYTTFKKEAPEILVQGPGYPSDCLPQLAGEDTTWITRALKLGLNDYNDVMGIHPYDVGHPFSLSVIMPDSVELLLTKVNKTFAETRRLQVEKFKKEYKNNRVWDTESGAIFNTLPQWMNSPSEIRLPWYTEQVASARMIRWNILRMAMGIERHFHFMFHFPTLPYHVLDLLNVDGTPRSGVAPLSTFYRLLDGSRFIGCHKLNGTTHLYVFRDHDGKTVAAYWDPVLENKPAGGIRFPRNSNITEALDMTGNPVRSDNGLYPLSDMPVYLKSGLPPEQFLQKLEKSEISLESFRSVLAPAQDSKGNLVLEAAALNLGTVPVKHIKIKLSDKREGVLTDIPPKGRKSIRFPLNGTAPGALSFEADFTGSNDRQHISMNKTLFQLKAAQKPAVPDGRIGKKEYSSVWSREFLPVGRGKPGPLSATLYASWLPDRLQFAIDVKDRTPITAGKGEAVSLGDGVELYLDFAPGKNPFSPLYPEEAVRISVNPAFPESPAFERNGLPAKTAVPFFDFEKVKAASSRTKDGYIVELEIPVKKALHPHQLLGFNFAVMDHGNTPEPNRGLSLAKKACWNSVLEFELLRLDAGKQKK